MPEPEYCFMKEYMEIVKTYLDAPDVFIEASAYHLISSLLGRFFRCPFIPGGSKGARPNIWFIIASIPGRTRRSTIANYSTYTYKEALKRYFIATDTEGGTALTDEEAKKKVNDTIIEEGTPEGITDHIQATNMDAYAIMSTEFGAVLTRMGTKDYELGLSSLFSKIYYGEGGSMMLSSRNKEVEGRGGRIRFLPEGLYATMFCGMQEPHLYLTPGMSRQGLLRRIVLVYCDPSDITGWMPPIQDDRQGVYEKLEVLSEKLVQKMVFYHDEAIRNYPFLLEITWHPNARNMINNYAKIADEALQHNVTNLTIYQQSFWEHLAKISMLNTLSRERGVYAHGANYRAFVTEEDVRKAKSFLDRATKYSGDIISSLGSLDEPIKTARDPLERIYQLVSSSPNGIVKSDLYRKSNMKASQLQDLLSTLLIQERVERIERPTGGRTTVIYKIKEG